MSSQRYHMIRCDDCGSKFEDDEQIERCLFETFGANEVRKMAHDQGWRYHSGADHCPNCRKVNKEKL